MQIVSSYLRCMAHSLFFFNRIPEIDKASQGCQLHWNGKDHVGALFSHGRILLQEPLKWVGHCITLYLQVITEKGWWYFLLAILSHVFHSSLYLRFPSETMLYWGFCAQVINWVFRKRWYLGLRDLHMWLNFNSFYLKSLWSLGCPVIEVDCFSLNWIEPRWCWDSSCNLVNQWALYDAQILLITEVPKNILSHRRWPQLQVTHWNHLCCSLIEYILKTKMVLLKPKLLHAL